MKIVIKSRQCLEQNITYFSRVFQWRLQTNCISRLTVLMSFAIIFCAFNYCPRWKTIVIPTFFLRLVLPESKTQMSTVFFTRSAAFDRVVIERNIASFLMSVVLKMSTVVNYPSSLKSEDLSITLRYPVLMQYPTCWFLMECTRQSCQSLMFFIGQSSIWRMTSDSFKPVGPNNGEDWKKYQD